MQAYTTKYGKGLLIGVLLMTLQYASACTSQIDLVLLLLWGMALTSGGSSYRSGLVTFLALRLLVSLGVLYSTYSEEEEIDFRWIWEISWQYFFLMTRTSIPRGGDSMRCYLSSDSSVVPHTVRTSQKSRFEFK